MSVNHYHTVDGEDVKASILSCKSKASPDVVNISMFLVQKTMNYIIISLSPYLELAKIGS